MASITIIGPGAIGGAVAAWLGQDPAHLVTIAARTPFSILKLDTPYGALVTTPAILTTPDQATVADWVLIATKTYDAESTAAWLPKLTSPHTRVAILQNGVEHIQRFAPYVTSEALVPVVVNLPAERQSPGHIWQRSDGHLTVADDSNGQEFVRLFMHTRITAATTTDFKSEAWRKLALNSTGAVSALLLKSIDINQHEAIVDVLRVLIRECIEVGRAEGAILDDALEEAVITGYRRGPSGSINSLHADRLAGRPMEIDARNGAIVRIGKRHGIDTPVNKMMVTLLEAAGS